MASGAPAIVVFEAGVDGYSHIRIPSLLTLEDGSLLAFAEGRAGGDHAKNDIILKRSTDRGITWGSIQILDDQGGDSLNDPMAVEIRRGPHRGRVVLFYMSFPEGCHTNCVKPGYGSDSSRNWMMTSDDRGATWSTPRDVTEIARRPTSSFAGSPGVGIQLVKGPHADRLVIPYRQGPLSRVRIYMLYSDDGGATWTRGELVGDGTDGGGGDEVAVAPNSPTARSISECARTQRRAQVSQDRPVDGRRRHLDPACERPRRFPRPTAWRRSSPSSSIRRRAHAPDSSTPDRGVRPAGRWGRSR